MNEIKHVENLWADTPDPSHQWMMRTRNRLLDEARGGRGGAGLRSWLPGPRLGVARVATASTLSVVLAGGLIASQTVDFGDGGSSPAATARADVVLQKAAAAAAAEAPAGEGDFAYLESKRVHPEASGSDTKVHVQQWLSVDDAQAGLRRSKTVGIGVPERLEEKGVTKQEWQQHERDWRKRKMPAGTQASGLVPDPSYAYLRSLPQDPDKLAEAIRQEASSLGESYGKGKLGIISMALAEQAVPPETAAALFQAAKRFDDVQVDETVTLAASGEQGTAVTHTANDMRTALVFDAKTYDFLGVQRTKDGKVFGSTAILEEGLVDKVGQRP